MSRFRDVALETLKENNPKALEEMRKDGSLDPYLEGWHKALKESMEIRRAEKWKAGAANPALEAEMEAMRDALDQPLFNGPENDS